MYTVKITTYENDVVLYHFDTLKEAKTLADFWAGLCANIQLFSNKHSIPTLIKHKV